MPDPGLRVGVAFGGRSVEHDVSIITGLQALGVLAERHRPVPIYLSRSGRWYTGEELRDLETYRRGAPDGQLPAEEVHFDLHNGRLLTERAGGGAQRRPGLLGGRLAQGGRGGRGGPRAERRGEAIELDVVVLATHGTQGEDGCLAGALELARLPYAGPSVGAAAATMDKVTTKAILAQAALPALDHLALRRHEWDSDRAATTARVAQRLGFPLYLKPASLGSSVGVSRCTSESELQDALQLGFELDRLCVAEPALEGGREINCAVLGRPGVPPRVSVCEQPIAGQEFLSFDDKYMRGHKGAGMKGAQRLIPAPLDDELTQRIQELARRAFAAFACAGVARVDFLLDAHDNVYINELNTIPGSFSFYLWEPAGLPFAALMDELLDIALAEARASARTTTVFDTNLLAERAGTKA